MTEPLKVHAEIEVPAQLEHLPDTLEQRDAGWERWRGRVDTQIAVIPEKIETLATALSTRLQDMDRNLNRRLDKQDKEIGAIHVQTKLTNGTVIRHDSEITAVREEVDELVEAAELAAQEAVQGVKHAEIVKRQDRQFKLTTLLSACGVTAAFVASVATILSVVLK